jgi:hypothetical protein
MTDGIECPVDGCGREFAKKQQLQGHIQATHRKLDRDAKPDIEGVSACPRCDSCHISWRKMTEDWRCKSCDYVCGPTEVVDRDSHAPASLDNNPTIRRPNSYAAALDRMSVDEFDEYTGGDGDE